MRYNKLDVWQRSVDFAVFVYKVTEEFPEKEKFGLISQMRRAAVSIARNVAEGEGRRSDPDKARFYLQARGSLYELETQIAISKRLGYVKTLAELRSHARQVGQLLNGSLRNLRTADGGRRTAIQ